MLKMRKVFETCPGRINEKLRKQFRDTQRLPFMLDMTRKPNWEQIFVSKNFVFSGKCRMVPKMLKGDYWDFLRLILLQIIKKNEGKTLSRHLKIFEKFHNAKKIERGPLVSSGFVA